MKEDNKMVESICLKCIQDSKTKGVLPVCLSYRDNPARWLSLLHECPDLKAILGQEVENKIKTTLSQVLENSHAIESIVGVSPESVAYQEDRKRAQRWFSLFEQCPKCGVIEKS